MNFYLVFTVTFPTVLYMECRHVFASHSAAFSRSGRLSIKWTSIYTLRLALGQPFFGFLPPGEENFVGHALTLPCLFSLGYGIHAASTLLCLLASLGKKHGVLPCLLCTCLVQCLPFTLVYVYLNHDLPLQNMIIQPSSMTALSEGGWAGKLLLHLSLQYISQ